MAFDERRLLIDVAADICLEAMLRETSAPACAALILHPHPQYGGDMHNHVVEALCRAFAAREATTLRFNFRGAGRSSGAYSGGRGEVDDARAALAELRRAAPDAPVALAGYSFGAQIAAVLAADEPVDALLLVSPPLMDGRALPDIQASIPVLAVTGDGDPVCPPERLRAVARDNLTVCIVPGAEHSWSGHASALAKLVGEMKFGNELTK